MFNLKGKVVIVTGGSRGIGFSAARLLSEYGAKVVITYLNSKDEAEKINSFPEVMTPPHPVEGLLVLGGCNMGFTACSSYPLANRNRHCHHLLITRSS